jgi:hypothetical protein
MRSVFLVWVLCVVCVAGEAFGGGKEREVEVVCKHPSGNLEVYRVLVKSLYDLTRSRSAMWDFRGKRLRDGKLVDVVTNYCHVEREVR